jgi:CO/xanthine dehydrogenase Mo-binding subunit
VTTVPGDTALTPSQGPTYASLTVQDGGMQIRRAAATARDALLDLAARRLNVAKAELAIHDGLIRPRSGGTEISYAQLVGDRRFSIKVDPACAIRKSSATKCCRAPAMRAKR